MPKADTLYAIAIADASTFDVGEVSGELVAISDDNPSIEWRTPKKRELLVVSVMSMEDLDTFYGEKGSSGYAPDDVPTIWVTVFPQLQEECRNWTVPPSDLKLRLNQYLGLRPRAPNEMIVELWVDRAEVFRPCVDPEVDDSSCRVGEPSADVRVDGIDDYAGFLASQAESSYEEGGYPWTGLGYTYDWNPDSSKVGASEFVLVPGARWSVHRVVALERYCSRVD